MELYEWTTHYIKFRDCMKKSIQNIICQDKNIIVEEKNKTITYHVCETLEKGISQLHNKEEVIVVHNTKQNFNELIKQWDSLVKHDSLTIIFVHPQSNEKWLIRPKIHHFITEEKKLKEGLKTLFESISRV